LLPAPLLIRSASGGQEAQRCKTRVGALKLYERLDPLVDGVVAEATKRGEPPSCKRGCDGCCRLPINVYLPEATPVALRILSEPGWRERLTRVAEHARKTVQVEDERDWVPLQIPCPLLDVEKRECSMYEVRPTPCRWYFVSSDKKLCYSTTPVAARVLNTLPVQALWTRIVCDSATEKGQTVPLPFTVAILIAAWHEARNHRKRKAIEELTKDIPMEIDYWWKVHLAGADRRDARRTDDTAAQIKKAVEVAERIYL
jgi:Fe-S-cluster containining protein